MLALAEFDVFLLTRGVVDVTWEFRPGTDSPDDYVVVIERSVQGEPFVAVTGDVSHLRVVRDANPERHTARRASFKYRLRVTHRNSGEQALLPEHGKGLEYGVDLHAAEIRRTLEVQLREFSGQKVVLFQKRRTGSRCTECYSVRLKKRTKGRCLNCYGTGFTGGFHQPMYVYMQILDATEGTVSLPDTKSDLTPASFLVAASPIVRSGDLVVEPATNMRWLIGGRLRAPTLGRAVLNRSGALIPLDNKSPFHDVPLRLEAGAIRGDFWKPWRNQYSPKTLG